MRALAALLLTVGLIAFFQLRNRSENLEEEESVSNLTKEGASSVSDHEGCRENQAQTKSNEGLEDSTKLDAYNHFADRMSEGERDVPVRILYADADPQFRPDLPRDIKTAQPNQPACSGECKKSSDSPSCYLDRPRIYFSGFFHADTPTVNNIVPNWNTEKFQLADELVRDREHARYNPTGTGSFIFRNVKVTRACPQTGDCNTNDEVVGKSIDSGISQVSGKIVDLDVEKMVPTLFGLKLGIHAYQGQPALSGAFKPAPSSGSWLDRRGTTDDFLTSSFQSVITNVFWGQIDKDGLNSTVLQQLKAVSPETLSIKFDVHHYHTDSENNLFMFGYINGTIGPGGVNEPENFVRGRLLRVLPQLVKKTCDDERYAPANLAPFVVRESEKRLTIDFGNTFARVLDDSGYDTTGLGQAVCLRTVNSKTPIGHAVNMTVPWLETNVIDFDISDTMQYVTDDFIELVQCGDGDEGKTIMREMDVLIRPMTRFMRHMNPGHKLPFTFFAYEKGQPKCNCELTLNITIGSNVKDGVTPPDKVPRALEGLTIDGKHVVNLFTDCDGKATAVFSASLEGPGNPRGHADLDGELYTVTYDSISFRSEPIFGIGTILGLHVYDKFEYEGEPTWWGTNDRDGVYNILKQYENLYPVMKPILALGDYFDVTKPRNIERLKRVFGAHENDPNYMPVTRDLSKAKLDMILKWMDGGSPPKLGKRKLLDLPGLCKALQMAIQVEHATIPTYLYPYFSIKPGANREIADILLSVILQEMLHVTLVANVMNAIDANETICPPPNLIGNDSIPVFPGPMPGGLRPELTLRLSRLSIGLIRDIFMEVEAPKRPISAVDVDPDDVHHNTIASFYKRIEKSMINLSLHGELKFRQNTSRQVSHFPGGNVYVVTNLATALAALREIVEQGEGSNNTDPDDQAGELSHYYRFAEVVEGKRLVKDNATGNWSFTGQPITFDPNGVWPVLDNARVRHYKEGTRARLLAEGFSRSYLDLLTQLHDVFNGNPEGANSSFSSMVAMRIKAQSLVVIPVNEQGEEVAHAGPPFENPLNLFNTYASS